MQTERVFPALDPDAHGDRRLAIVVPVYNDWGSFYALIADLEAVLVRAGMNATVLAVDDGSAEQIDATHEIFSRLAAISSVEVVRLACNLGHQRALAVGLVLTADRDDVAYVVVMDADGEDRPDDVLRLLAASQQPPGRIACAARRQRSEGIAFRAGYRLYKLVFRCLTGATIDFGNFCVLPRGALRSLIVNPGIWNHLAATVVRSRIPHVSVPASRGRRYSGNSHMNLVALASHGLSAISIYSETALVRILLVLIALSAVTACALVGVVAIRLFTDAAIPGWASIVGGSLLTLLLQAIAFSVIMAFFVLSTRSSPAVVPVAEARKFVLSRTVVVPVHE